MPLASQRDTVALRQVLRCALRGVALEGDLSRLRSIISSLYLQAGNTLRLDDELEGWASSADDRLCLSAAGLVGLSFDEECDAIRNEVNDFAERARRRGVEWPSVK